MDSATQDLYFQKIDEFVKDEDKIVTCIYLARELNISIQDSKLLISKYVEDQKHLKSIKLSVTYLISGILKEGDLGVYWVKEENLPEKKKVFKEITTEVIYSIQKNKCIDFDAIVLVNKTDKQSPLLGSTIGKNCVKRNLKVKNLPIPQAKPSTTKSFFNTTTEEKTKKSSPKPAKPKNAGISNFFTKQNSKNVEEANKVTKTEDNEEVKQKVEIKNIEKESEEEPKKSEGNEKIEKKNTNEVAENSKKRRKSKKNELPNKRRKRIEDVHNSDSSDMFDSEKEDIIEMSEEEIKPTPQPNLLAPKNKRRKAVDRTYVDDEGYIVTKVEYIYETASEEEVEMKEIQKENKSKVTVAKKTNGELGDVAKTKGKKGKKPTGKQPTLMSFFSKK